MKTDAFITKNTHIEYNSFTKIFNLLICPLIAPLMLLAVWHYASVKIDNEVVLPPVKQVFDILIHPNADLLSMGSLFSNVLMSTMRVMFGYLAAIILAVPLGILMGYSRLSNRMLSSLVEILRPLPPLAWIPLILAWFGVASFATIAGIEEGQWYILLNNIKISMLIIIFIGAFFPVLLNTIQGVSSVKKTLIDSALVLGATQRDIFCKILLPGAAPSIVTGMRLGLGVSWMCLVAAEMMPGSISGIGYIITHAYTLARTDIVMAGMVSIGVIGLMIDVSFKKFESKSFAWQRLSK